MQGWGINMLGRIEANQIKLKVGRELFSFHSEQNWVNTARNLYFNCGLPRNHIITIDSAGRVCANGGHFMRATREGAYPVKAYAIE